MWLLYLHTKLNRVHHFLSVVLDIKSCWVNNFEEFGNSQIIKTQTLTPAHKESAFPSNKISFHLLSNCLNHGSQTKALVPGMSTDSKVKSRTQVRKSEITLFVKTCHISADALNPVVALLLSACGSQGCRRFIVCCSWDHSGMSVLLGNAVCHSCAFIVLHLNSDIILGQLPGNDWKLGFSLPSLQVFNITVCLWSL